MRYNLADVLEKHSGLHVTNGWRMCVSGETLFNKYV